MTPTQNMQPIPYGCDLCGAVGHTAEVCPNGASLCEPIEPSRRFTLAAMVICVVTAWIVGLMIGQVGIASARAALVKAQQDLRDQVELTEQIMQNSNRLDDQLYHDWSACRQAMGAKQ